MGTSLVVRSSLWTERMMVVWSPRARPSAARNVELGEVTSPLGTAPFQTYTSAPTNKAFWPSHRPYIYLAISAPGIQGFGVTVEYHRNIWRAEGLRTIAHHSVGRDLSTSIADDGLSLRRSL